jgi:hypothetical protein
MATEPKQTALRLVKGVAVVFVVLTLATTSLVYGTIVRSAPKHLPPVDPPRQMLPGNPLPAQAICSWPPYASESMSCHLSSDGQSFYFTYSAQQGIIIRTAMAVEDQTIGELITAWGPPSGVQIYPWTVLVSWDSRSVFVASRPFSPGNRVSFVRYTLEPESTGPWQGFVSGSGHAS